MKQNRHHLFLGIFVLTAIGLIAASVTMLGAKSLWEEHVIMETYTEESVNGLETGSAVKFRGIPIGKVDLITTVYRIYDTKKSYAYIRAKIFDRAIPTPPAGETVSEDMDARVDRGLRVSLTPANITGGTYLELDYVAEPKRAAPLEVDWIPTTIYVPCVPSTFLRFRAALDTVLSNLARTDLPGTVAATRDTLARIDQAVADLDLADLGARARRVLDDAGRFATTAGRNLDKLSVEFETAIREVRGGVDKTLAGADKTLAGADKALARIDELLGSDDLGAALAQLPELAEQARLAVADIRGLARRGDQAMAGVGQTVRGHSRELAAAIGNLRDLLGNINSLTRTLKEYPSLLFAGNPPQPANKQDK